MFAVMRFLAVLGVGLHVLAAATSVASQTATEVARHGDWRVMAYTDPFSAKPICNVISVQYQWVSAWRNELLLKFSEPGQRTVRFKTDNNPPRAAHLSRDGAMAYLTGLDFGRARSVAIQIQPERDPPVVVTLDLVGLREADNRARRAPCPAHSGL